MPPGPASQVVPCFLGLTELLFLPQPSCLTALYFSFLFEGKASSLDMCGSSQYPQPDLFSCSLGVPFYPVVVCPRRARCVLCAESPSEWGCRARRPRAPAFWILETGRVLVFTTESTWRCRVTAVVPRGREGRPERRSRSPGRPGLGGVPRGGASLAKEVAGAVCATGRPCVLVWAVSQGLHAVRSSQVPEGPPARPPLC